MKYPLEKLVKKCVQKYARGKGFPLPEDLDCGLSMSRDPSHGHYASNVAFRLMKAARRSPQQVAEDLVRVMEDHMRAAKVATGIERMEVAGGGFVNFYLTKSSLAGVLVEVHRRGARYGSSKVGGGKRVLLEFVSANPTGPLTVAHGRQAAIGDALARILAATGHRVETEYYLNDSGRQMNLLGQSLWARYGQKLGKQIPLPEEGYQGLYLVELAEELTRRKKDSLLKATEQKALRICREFAVSRLMQQIRRDLKDFGVAFDHYLAESSLYPRGDVQRAIDELRKKGHVYEGEGALWFRATSFGDDKDRVLRKSSGEMTYLAPDIAYHRDKFARGFRLLVNLWGPDHHGYVTRLKAACRALGHDPKEVEIRIVQLTTLYRKGEPVRMSTRAGEFITLRQLLDEVGRDAARFFFVMRRVESPLDFDLDLAKQQSQENPVYYLQYAHARIASLLKFAKMRPKSKIQAARLESPEELELIKVISEYPEILVQASESLEPYRVADYLRELATCFHRFYTFHRVVTEDRELTDSRLLLAEATGVVLRNGLKVLGISHPEKM